jgi:hypothetical protein
MTMFSKTQLERFVLKDIQNRKTIKRREIIQLWESIEHHRAETARLLAIFEGWLDITPELYADWCEFTELGGITAHELRRFLDGQTIRRRPMRKRRHLRLISTNKRRAVRASHGDDAA